MNAELKKIEAWLRQRGGTPRSYRDLSKNVKGDSLVPDDLTTEAYNYDAVVGLFYTNKTLHRCCSCDALLLKEHLYLIETLLLVQVHQARSLSLLKSLTHVFRKKPLTADLFSIIRYLSGHRICFR